MWLMSANTWVWLSKTTYQGTHMCRPRSQSPARQSAFSGKTWKTGSLQWKSFHTRLWSNVSWSRRRLSGTPYTRKYSAERHALSSVIIEPGHPGVSDVRQPEVGASWRQAETWQTQHGLQDAACSSGYIYKRTHRYITKTCLYNFDPP